METDQTLAHLANVDATEGIDGEREGIGKGDGGHEDALGGHG